MWHADNLLDAMLRNYDNLSEEQRADLLTPISEIQDLPRFGPMLSPRVPNLVPIPGPRMERETPGQRLRPNYGHPQAEIADTPATPCGSLPTRLNGGSSGNGR